MFIYSVVSSKLHSRQRCRCITETKLMSTKLNYFSENKYITQQRGSEEITPLNLTCQDKSKVQIRTRDYGEFNRRLFPNIIKLHLIFTKMKYSAVSDTNRHGRSFAPLQPVFFKINSLLKVTKTLRLIEESLYSMRPLYQLH